MGHNDLPEGDHIYDLYTGVYKPHIIRVALVVDAFSPLATCPAKAKTVAQVCKCDACRWKLTRLMRTVAYYPQPCGPIRRPGLCQGGNMESPVNP